MIAWSCRRSAWVVCTCSQEVGNVGYRVRTLKVWKAAKETLRLLQRESASAIFLLLHPIFLVFERYAPPTTLPADSSAHVRGAHDWTQGSKRYPLMSSHLCNMDFKIPRHSDMDSEHQVVHTGAGRVTFPIGIRRGRLGPPEWRGSALDPGALCISSCRQMSSGTAKHFSSVTSNVGTA